VASGLPSSRLQKHPNYVLWVQLKAEQLLGHRSTGLQKALGSAIGKCSKFRRCMWNRLSEHLDWAQAGLILTVSQEKNRPLIFFGHSLGGILILQVRFIIAFGFAFFILPAAALACIPNITPSGRGLLRRSSRLPYYLENKPHFCTSRRLGFPRVGGSRHSPSGRKTSSFAPLL
jgi:hypothetical protein